MVRDSPPGWLLRSGSKVREWKAEEPPTVYRRSVSVSCYVAVNRIAVNYSATSCFDVNRSLVSSALNLRGGPAGLSRRVIIVGFNCLFSLVRMLYPLFTFSRGDEAAIRNRTNGKKNHH